MRRPLRALFVLLPILAASGPISGCRHAQRLDHLDREVEALRRELHDTERAAQLSDLELMAQRDVDHELDARRRLREGETSR